MMNTLRRSRTLACILATALALLLGDTVWAQPIRTTVSADTGQVAIAYTIKLSGQAGDVVRIEIPTSRSAKRSLPGSAGCIEASQSESKATKLILTCTLKDTHTSVTVQVTDDEPVVVIDSRQTAVVTVGEKRREVPNVQVLRSADVDGRIQTVVGGAFALLRDDFADFTVKDGTLLLQNDSRTRPTLLAGALIRAFAVKNHDIGLHASTQFAPGGAALDGFSLGVGIAINPRAHLTAGVLFRRGKELSPGFLRAVNATGKDVARLDGLPLKNGDLPIFPGDPIIDSHNMSFYVGVVVPVDLGGLLGLRPSKKEEE